MEKKATDKFKMYLNSIINTIPDEIHNELWNHLISVIGEQPSLVSLDTHTREGILLKHINEEMISSRGNIYKVDRLDQIIAYKAMLKAMTEYASQESLKARQEHQESINKALDRLNFADKSLVKHPDCYTDDRIQSALDFISTAFHELSKLKSDSRNHPSDTKKDSLNDEINH